MRTSPTLMSRKIKILRNIFLQAISLNLSRFRSKIPQPQTHLKFHELSSHSISRLLHLRAQHPPPSLVPENCKFINKNGRVSGSLQDAVHGDARCKIALDETEWENYHNDDIIYCNIKNAICITENVSSREAAERESHSSTNGFRFVLNYLAGI